MAAEASPADVPAAARIPERHGPPPRGAADGLGSGRQRADDDRVILLQAVLPLSAARRVSDVAAPVVTIGPDLPAIRLWDWRIHRRMVFT